MTPAAASDQWTLAIDFGTSFTVAAVAVGPEPPEPVYFGAKRTPTMPSGVYVQEDGSLLTGTKAANQRQLDPERYVATPKRYLTGGARTIPLPSGPLSLVRVVSAVMGEVAILASGQRGGTAPSRTVLTYPAGWDSDLQRLLVTAATQAGLTSVLVLAEPVAAALYLGRDGRRPGDAIAVYDLGGGTFDAAVLRWTADGFQVAATDGQTSIGGEWFDEVLQAQLNSGPLGQVEAWRRLNSPGPDKQSSVDAYRTWRNQVELLKENICFTKETLSDEKSWGLIIPDYSEGWTVTREMLDHVLREPLKQTVDVLGSAISRAGLPPDQLAAIYLVGGASRIPLVGELLAERFPGKVANRRGDPQTAVALGAAGHWADAVDLDRLPKPARKDPPEQVKARSSLVPWKSRLAVTAAGSGTSVRVDHYEATLQPYFFLRAAQPVKNRATLGAFAQTLEQAERKDGWEMTRPKDASFTGATLGLTQQGSKVLNGESLTLTKVYADVSTFLVTAWARSGKEQAAVESLSIDFRNAGPSDHLVLSMSLPTWLQQGMSEKLFVRVKTRLESCNMSIRTGPPPEGADTPEKVAAHLLAELKKTSPASRNLVVQASAPDVFLNSRLCVHQNVTVQHWWTGLVDGRFVWIAVGTKHRRLAERCRDMVSLR